MATLVATRGTCARRRVGCVLVDDHNRVLSTGYNGVASGMQHCTEHPCPGALLKSGTGLDQCEAVHAEINALIFCPDARRVHTAYLTCTPCTSCVKALMTSGCRIIVASELYPHSDAVDLWLQSGRKLIIVHSGTTVSVGGLKAGNSVQKLAGVIFGAKPAV